MTARHTPGPWDASAINADLPLTRIGHIRPGVGGDSPCIALLAGTRPHAETSANARLIAAAPDLLDIIETIAVALARGYTTADVLDENSPVRDRIRAVIAKVEGE